ncbi:MAG: hypothetical protein AAF657_14895 [Acidobacteriota bacterium]
MLGEHVDHVVEIRIAGAELASEPIAAALHDRFTVDQNVELAGLTRGDLGVEPEPLLDQSRETRGFVLVVASGRAVVNGNLHGDS